MTKIKICGTTNIKDALKISSLGADFIGFIFYSKSPRYINPEKAAEIIGQLDGDIKTVGVFVNESVDVINKIVDMCKLDYVQLHGDEEPAVIKQINAPIIKVFRISPDFDFSILNSFSDAFAYLFDNHNNNLYGGTGKSFDLGLIKSKSFNKPIFLSGGISIINVEKKIDELKPFAVDICSGAESSHGNKDFEKLKKFIKKVKSKKQ